MCSYHHRLDEMPYGEPLVAGGNFSRLGNLEYSCLKSASAGMRLLSDRAGHCEDDHYVVLLMRDGCGVLRQDGRTAVLQPGDFSFYDCTRPYELCLDGPSHEMHMLRLDHFQLDTQVSNLHGLTATTIAADQVAARLLASTLVMLATEGERMDSAPLISMSDAIINIIVAGLRGLPEANVEKASTLAAYHRARVRAYVRNHVRDPALSVGSIAAAMQLSSDHLCKLFRDEPMPLSRWIWALRLDGCRRDLCDVRLATRSVSDIAYSRGFNDAAHFSRSFRERFGKSPRSWRLLQAAPQTDDESSDVSAAK